MDDHQNNSGLAPLIKLSFPAHDRGSFIMEFSSNVSAGGLFFPTEEPLSPGSEFGFLIEVVYGYPMLRGEGVVVWARGTDEYRPTRRRGMGIKFVRIDPRSKEILEEMLQSQSRQSAERNSDVPDSSSMMLAPDGSPMADDAEEEMRGGFVEDPMTALETMASPNVDVEAVLARVVAEDPISIDRVDDELERLAPDGFDEAAALERPLRVDVSEGLPAIAPPAAPSEEPPGEQVAEPEPVQVAEPEPVQVAEPEPVQVAEPEPVRESEEEPEPEPEPKIGLFDEWDEELSEEEELAEPSEELASDEEPPEADLSETFRDFSDEEPLDEETPVEELAETVADLSSEKELANALLAVDGLEAGETGEAGERLEPAVVVDPGEELFSTEGEETALSAEVEASSEWAPDDELSEEPLPVVDEDTSETDSTEEPAEVVPYAASEESPALTEDEETSEIPLEAAPDIDLGAELFAVVKEAEAELESSAIFPDEEIDVDDIPTTVVPIDDGEQTPIEAVEELDSSVIEAESEVADVFASPGAADYVSSEDPSLPETQDIDESDLMEAEDSMEDGPLINPDEISGILEGLPDENSDAGMTIDVGGAGQVDMSVWQPGSEMPPMGISDAPEELSVEIRDPTAFEEPPTVQGDVSYVDVEMPPMGISDAPEELSVEVQGVSPDAAMFEIALPTDEPLEPVAADYDEISVDDIAGEEVIDEAEEVVDEEYLSLSSQTELVDASDYSEELTSMDLSNEEPLAEVVSGEDIAEEISADDIAEESIIPDDYAGGTGVADGTDPKIPHRPSEADQVIDVLLSGGLPLEEPTPSTFHSDAVTTVDLEEDTGKSPHPLFEGDSYLMGMDKEGSEELVAEDSASFESGDESLEGWLAEEPQSQEEATLVQGGPPPWSPEIAAKYGVQQTPSTVPPPAEVPPEQNEDGPPESGSDAPATAAQTDESLAMVQPPLGKAQPKKRKSFFRKLFGGGE